MPIQNAAHSNVASISNMLDVKQFSRRFNFIEKKVNETLKEFALIRFLFYLPPFVKFLQRKMSFVISSIESAMWNVTSKMWQMNNKLAILAMKYIQIFTMRFTFDRNWWLMIGKHSESIVYRLSLISWGKSDEFHENCDWNVRCVIIGGDTKPFELIFLN